MITVELIPDHEQGGFTARLPDCLPTARGRPKYEAIADLREALCGYIEAFGLDDAVSRVSSPSAIRQVDWNFETCPWLSAAQRQGFWSTSHA